jgi:polyferredoxin
MGYPKGLIRYTTQNALEGRPSRVLRPRIAIYGALLLVLVAAWAWGVGHRAPLTVEAMRDRNALYRPVADGTDNGYTLKLANKTDAPQRYRITLVAPRDGLELRGVPDSITVPAQAVLPIEVTVHGPASLSGRHPLRFDVHAADGSAQARVDSSFFGPM